jgi:hypothetical protein
MRRTWTTGLTALFALALGSQAAYGQIPLNDITWVANPATPADWNVDNNWDPAFVPSLPLGGDRAIIGNGGTAFINSNMLDPVGALRIDNGGLEIRSGGMLDVLTDNSLDDPEEGIAFIGGSGRGQLDVLSGGAFNPDSLIARGAADSTFTMRGTATMEVTNDARLERITRIIGPGVSAEVGGDLRLGGTFIPEITGAAHSTIQVPLGNATLGGTLRPEFSGGFSPMLGDSWTLITADTVSGSFASIDTSQVPALPRGVFFGVELNPGASTNVDLVVTNRLVLTVNRVSGAVAMENVVGDPIDIDGYSIGSAAGNLDPAGWTSLEGAGTPDWREIGSPSASLLAELNPTGSSTLNVGNQFSMGSAFQATSFGQPEDIAFEYTSPGSGEIITGVVEYIGPHNNLVLTVDPTSGEAVLQNPSSFSADIDGYIISSPSGSLLPADGQWNSFQDQGEGAWEEASPTTFNLSELNPTGATTFGSGSLFNLGTLFDTGGSQDLGLEFHLAGGGILNGVVEFGDLPMMGVLGDTDGDGDVDIDDLNNVRNQFGGMGLGDTDGDNDVDIDDLNNVRNNFGAMSPAPVPEPAAFLLLVLGWALVAAVKPRR